MTGPLVAPWRPRISLLWWARRGSYLLFALRELSSLAVAWSVVYLLLLGHAVVSGEAAYRRFVEWSGAFWVLAVNVVALAFVVLHAVTWFNLAPQALVVRVRGRRIPPRLVAGGHFAAWLVVSAFVAWVVLS